MANKEIMANRVVMEANKEAMVVSKEATVAREVCRTRLWKNWAVL